MGAEAIVIEVAYATTTQQCVIALKVAPGCTLKEAILLSGILQKFPEIDLNKQKVGVFSEICRLDKILNPQDRVEIYRPLLQNPMEARRARIELDRN